MVSALRQPGAERRTARPLENGDQMEADEFLRRYELMPDVKKIELIEGFVFMPSPVSLNHAEPHAHLITWVNLYKMSTPGLRSGDNATLKLGKRSVPQPDVLLFIPAEAGGLGRVGQDKYLEGATEFIAEIASSSVSLDAGTKKKLYQKNGVQEYLLWRVQDEAIDWYRLQNKKYELLPIRDGVIRSEVFPGLWLNVPAMLAGDLKAVFETLQRGVATKEHAAFVKRLASQAK